MSQGHAPITTRISGNRRETEGLGSPASTGLGSPASTGLGSPASTGLGSPASTGLRSPASTGLGSPASTGLRSSTGLGPRKRAAEGAKGGLSLRPELFQAGRIGSVAAKLHILLRPTVAAKLHILLRPMVYRLRLRPTVHRRFSASALDLASRVPFAVRGQGSAERRPPARPYPSHGHRHTPATLRPRGVCRGPRLEPGPCPCPYIY